MIRLKLCHFTLLWLTNVIIPCYGVQLCAQGHIFLVSNRTHENGATLTYTNTFTQELHNVTFEGHYLPSSFVCGERNGRCGASSLFNRDGTILVAVVPFGDGVGLVSHQFDNISMIYREKLFLSYTSGCVPAYFPPITDPLEPLYGYCLALSTQAIENIVVSVNFERLNNSHVERAINFPRFTFLSNSFLSNFVFFPEIRHFCFSSVNGHTVFLQNSDIVFHSIASREYYSDIGSISVRACSSSEPRLQRLGTECKLAAYCNRTAVLFNAPESFGGVTRFSDDVFLCSSNFYVRFMNGSLSIHRVSNDEQISGSIALEAEAILLGDCLISEGQFYFVATLSGIRTVFVDFSNRTTISLGENTHPMLVPYAIMNDLLFVNNGAHSLVYNWTRMCPEDLLVVPTNFDLVHSFSDQSLSEECGCVQDRVTTTTTTDTTTSQMESSTFAPSTTETTSRLTTEQPTNTLSPISSLSMGGRAGLAIGVVAILIIFVVVLIVLAYLWIRRSRRRNPPEACRPSDQGQRSDDKRNLRKLNKQNNDSLEHLNNRERETVLTQEEQHASPPLDLRVEESQSNQDQAELIPSDLVRGDVSSVINAANQSVNSLGENEQYPVNAVATSQQTPPDLRENNHQIVAGVTPSINGASLSTQVDVNNNPDTASGGNVADPTPSLYELSPNHVPVLRDNRNAEVTAVAQCDTNGQEGSSDLVRPPAPWPNLHVQSQERPGHGIQKYPLDLLQESNDDDTC